jgi:NADH-quinone oxidoreductase subunit L
MESGNLSTLFPATDFSLIAVILGMPLAGALVNGVWGRRLGKEAVRLMALAAVGTSFAAAVVAFLQLDLLVRHNTNAEGVHEHVKLTWTAWEWMRTNGLHGVTIPIDVRFSIDALNGVMLLVVTGVGFLIHLYSTSYMENDPGFARFFAYLNLFIFSMLVLILGDNLPVLFVGWEGVGLCSYLLIGFWYDKMPNAAAGKKAFIANRIGDFGLICAMFLLVYYTGALDWTGINNGTMSLVNPSEAAQVHLWPVGGGQFTGIFSFLQPKTPITITPATAVGLALLLGCAGKSAQIPLYVWLPDAMAGPTPVSALIHAATMVTAGIYLVCRLSFVFVLSPAVMLTIAVVGISTALLAGTIALVQNDIKKVLAYSTVSQLGYMFLGVGVGAFTQGFFHVFTHAFFKACLFLGAGSVIHAMHARVHDDVQSQDIRNMGGLRKYMPLTYWSFLASTLAIAGCPLTSGFFSKDEILYRAFVDHTVNPFSDVLKHRGVTSVFEPPMWIGPTLFVLGMIGAVLTAFYMFRVFFLTFHGDFRGWAVGRPSLLAAEERPSITGADDAHAAHEEHAHHEDLRKPGYPPHESPWEMTVPLIILGTCAIFAGVLNMGIFHFAPMERWLEPVFETASRAIQLRPGAEHLEFPLAAVGVLAFAVGSGAAYWVYIARQGEPASRAAEAAPALYRFLLDKWRVDEFYDYTILAGVDALGETIAAFDQTIVDGVLAKLTALIASALGTILRAFQNGVIHMYAAIMVVGLAALGWFFVTPHSDVTIVGESNGDYVVQAGPGMGYTYRWDADGNGQPDREAFSDLSQVKVTLRPGETRAIKLEVTNAFGIKGSKMIPISRPEATKVLEVGQK